MAQSPNCVQVVALRTTRQASSHLHSSILFVISFVKDIAVISIRAASEADQPAISKIWHQGWHDAHAELVPAQILAYRQIEHFRNWLATSTDRFFVVSLNAMIIGFVAINGAELVKLYIDRHARGDGTSARLLQFGEDRIRETGVRRAVLFCTDGNLRAEKFYRRQGWSLMETFPDRLWLPDHAQATLVANTHRFEKALA